MRKTLTAVVIVAAVATSGCSVFRSKSRTPDEFAVARNAPLIIPPDFSLTPPVAGTAGLSVGDAQAQAIDALFGGPAPRSASEMMMLDTAGRDRAQVGIRSQVWDPDTRVVDKGAATIQILNAPAADSNVASAQAGQ
jgi:hypothetical protein